MQISLSKRINNLSEIYSKECKRCRERNKIVSVCDFIGFKNNRLHYKCNKYEKRWLTPRIGLIKKFPNTYKFCIGDINKFILLLRKGAYPYEHRERFGETSLPDKKAFLQ